MEYIGADCLRKQRQPMLNLMIYQFITDLRHNFLRSGLQKDMKVSMSLGPGLYDQPFYEEDKSALVKFLGKCQDQDGGLAGPGQH